MIYFLMETLKKDSNSPRKDDSVASDFKAFQLCSSFIRLSGFGSCLNPLWIWISVDKILTNFKVILENNISKFIHQAERTVSAWTLSKIPKNGSNSALCRQT